MEPAAVQQQNDGMAQQLPPALPPISRPTTTIAPHYLERICLSDMKDVPDSRLMEEGPILVGELDWAWNGRFWDPYYRRTEEYPGWRYSATNTPHFAQAVACMTRLTRKCVDLNFPLNLVYEKDNIMHMASSRFFNCFNYTLTPRVVNAAYDLLVALHPTRLLDLPPTDSDNDISIEAIQNLLELQKQAQEK
ncbi:hypothetical protein CkaCkLH20_11413 [Colletotrichum karsti]|uniref:Uncharacterized protein n=1 Tax=Colletotrichum karsti TaxID=1095194 RepID=A0A9P6HZ21_9PEZI|nr:uncharacterized protein CkaCkLH20_11413 [Colletotrichum karsti]KAF9870996.1 hypothetical protein CkaCkLH20_11413 [Colletotrichum karsti]